MKRKSATGIQQMVVDMFSSCHKSFKILLLHMPEFHLCAAQLNTEMTTAGGGTIQVNRIKMNQQKRINRSHISMCTSDSVIEILHIKFTFYNNVDCIKSFIFVSNLRQK